MKPRIFIVVALACLIGTSSLIAAERVLFHGNRVFSNGELQNFLGRDDFFKLSAESLDVQLQSLQDSLIAHDFLFAKVDSVVLQTRRRDRTDLAIYLHEGELARISSVEWLGDSTLIPEAEFERVLTTAGAMFRWSNLVYDINRLLDYFENFGYPFARIDIHQIAADSVDQAVALKLVVHSGPRTALEFVSFPGVRQTRESYLLRESRLKTGGLYDQRQIVAARRRLGRLEFVKSVGTEEIAADESGRTGVRVPLQEMRSTRLDIVAGYLPETDTRPALLTGLVNVELLNLFGVGRKARVHWERPDRRIQAVEVSYREPWILGQPLALRADFGQRIEDTLYVTRKLGIRAELDLFASVNVWGLVQQEEILTDSVSSLLLDLPDSRTTYLESGFAVDSRGHPTNPRSGAYFSTHAGTGWRKRSQAVNQEPAGSFRHRRGGIDAEVAQELFPFWIADLSLHARALETTEPQVLLPDLYRLGGARTLRGYREEQFLGSRVGWASAELRYWLGPASRVFVFGDAGSAYRKQRVNETLKESTIFRMGAGVGLRLDTDIGIWGFDYGVGEDDRLLSGKLHVSLLSTF